MMNLSQISKMKTDAQRFAEITQTRMLSRVTVMLFGGLIRDRAGSILPTFICGAP